MCVVNKQFGVLQFVFDSVYVDLKDDDISLILMLGLCACMVSVVVWSRSLVCM